MAYTTLLLATRYKALKELYSSVSDLLTPYSLPIMRGSLRFIIALLLGGITLI